MFILFLLVYNLIWLVLLILSFPYYVYLLFKGKSGKLLNRFGIFSCTEKEYIWLHAASVGEVKIALAFIDEIRTSSMETVLLTVQTDAGYELANKSLPINTRLSYVPFDFFVIHYLLLYFIKVKKFIVIETEIWPSLYASCIFERVPIYMINARISDKSFPKYLKFKFILSKILPRVLKIFSQTKEYKNRFVALGADQRSIEIIPNMKYDLIKLSKETKQYFIDSKVFTAASIRSPEEIYVIETFKKLQEEFPNLLCIIAPRHLENVEKIENILKKENLAYQKYSKTGFDNLNTKILIIDQMGVLIEAYKNSDVVFVGGSLVNKGGQNILEPAALGKPVIFGKFMSNFKEESKVLLENNSAIQIDSEELLVETVKSLFLDQVKCDNLGLNAIGALENQSGSIKKIKESIFGRY
ncbi:3-deoxy-D-manno-octulosonic acid transferase [bacterium]